MAPRNAQSTIPDTQIALTVKPQLEIFLRWSIADGAERHHPPPAGVQALRIVSRSGQHLFYDKVDGVKPNTPLFARVNLASVLVEGRLFFDIILSTCTSTYLVATPKENVAVMLTSKEDEETSQKPTHGDVAASKDILSSLMRDIATTNMAFTFDVNGSAHSVALWVHQSVLSHQPYMASLFSKLQDIEGSDDTSVSGIKSTHVSEYSLESYCSLVRFLYTGVIDLEVNLEDFSIGCPPVKPFNASCKKRPVVEGLFSPAVGTSCIKDMSGVKRRTDWRELFQVADCYDVRKLREYCKSKILASITTENALETLFQFAFQYKDMKDVLLQHVAGHMDKMFVEAKGEDPFAGYKDHPERHSLLIQVLQLKFKTMA
ncbi:hypothetical protein MVEG_00149 [Podila verticillata NRRL 6337]|nr:hypothetical protein MVEG_00149 [Podila verticillata NRRL 6337]